MKIDRREDAGEFYPGGVVISVRPIVSGGNMKHEDFSDVAALPSRFTDKMVHDKINELIGLLKGPSAAVALLLGVAAFGAGVTVQTAPKDEVYNDEQIVTNVVFDATGLVSEEEIGSIRVELGSIRVGLESVSNEVGSVSNEVANLSNSIDFSTSNETLVATIEAKAPAPDFSTSNETLVATIEATAPAPGDYAAVSNKAVNALSRAEAEAGFTEWVYTDVSTGVEVIGQPIFVSDSVYDTYWQFQLLLNGAPASLYIYDNAYATTLRAVNEGDYSNISFTATRTRLPTMAEAASPSIVTNIVRDLSLGGIWDAELEVWWTPRMRNGSLTYEATTNVNLNAVN